MKARLRRTIALAALAVLTPVGALGIYAYYLDGIVRDEFQGRRWDLPAKVFAAPIELYAGAPHTAEELERELRQLRYRSAEDGRRPGTYLRRGPVLVIGARRARFADEAREAAQITVVTNGEGVLRISDAAGHDLPVFRLDPLPIGSIYPVHGEDRIVLGPADVPPLLPVALEVVEDRRFDEHHGIDPRGLLRAAWVNLRAGHVEQGGSTLTQQLVKSYFLDEQQTFARKSKEAIMALSLEARFSKAEIMNAYLNEIYLGQDGERAIHGFGLASEFYFAKPVDELDLGELALLVGIVRGPSYYDPRRHPERARARRDLVLRLLAEQHVVSAPAAGAAMARPLRLRAPSTGVYFPAYLDLVRRTLKRDYREGDLATAGLSIYTGLDPRAQASAERALARELARLDPPGRHRGAPLEGAVVVTLPESGEVVALVGGRQTGFDGFDRALDARRPIGSLVKPLVYLAALETGRYNAASVVDDAPLEVPLGDGSLWRPEDFERGSAGPVPLVRALAESLNLATVRLGLDVGVGRVAAMFARLGLERTPPAHPSLLLGAVDLTPFEVAGIYACLANGGFRNNLRAVRAVLDENGKPLKTFPMKLVPVADPAHVFALNMMLTQVVARGTARAAGARFLPATVMAGKTGTSSDLRDSWFAGYAMSHLAVVWVGHDDNRPSGLTGAAGALPVWSEVMAGLHPASFAPVPPDAVELRRIEFSSGLALAPGCSTDAVEVAVPRATVLPARAGCGEPPPAGLVERLRTWLNRTH